MEESGESHEESVPARPSTSRMDTSIFKVPTIPGESLVARLEKNYLENRDQLLLEDGFIMTPLKALRDMAYEWNTVIEITTFEIHFPRESLSNGVEKVLNRVLISIGHFQGDGEAPRHRLACQMAAADLLEKMKIEGAEVPECGLPPGYRTSSRVYADLKELARMENLEAMPTFTQVTDPEKLDLPQPSLFAFICTIGYLNCTGASDSLFLAKRLSAKSVFETLTGEMYPDDRVATGDGCIKYEDLKEMGIKPVKSIRKARLGRTTEDGLTRKRAEDDDDIYDDDFAEEEDNLILMREQLKRLEVTKRGDGDDDASD